jgi:hypothetical protein
MDVEESRDTSGARGQPIEHQTHNRDSRIRVERRFSSPATSTPISSVAPDFPSSPSREEERDFILHAMAERLRPNQTLFIISMGWWNTWKVYVGLDAYSATSSSPHQPTSPRPGPINNLALCHDKDCPTLMELCALRVLAMQKQGHVSVSGNSNADENTTEAPRLNMDVQDYLAHFDKTLMRRALCRAREMRAGLIEGRDCVAVSGLAWKALHAWYGGGPIIPRPVIGVGLRQRLRVELYPVTLLVLPINSGRSSDRETHRFTFSPLDQLKTVRRAVCGRFLHPPHKVELYWHYRSVSEAGDVAHLSDLDLTLGQVGLHDGCLVSIQRTLLTDPLGMAAQPTAAAVPPQQQQEDSHQLPQNDGRPMQTDQASPSQPL